MQKIKLYDIIRYENYFRGVNMICRKCGTTKRTKANTCAECQRASNRRSWIKNKERNNLLRKEYKKTAVGKAAVLWSSMYWRAENKADNPKSNNYENVKLLITRAEFITWVIPELEKWCNNDSIENVSLDRIDSTKHYELNNLQLVTKSENSRKSAQHKNVSAPDGYAWCGKCQDYLIVSFFHKNKIRFNGLEQVCKFHKNLEYEKKRYELSKMR